MSLKFRIASMDGIDESLKALYKAAGNEFILDVEGGKSDEEIKNLESTMRKERDRANSLQREFDKLGGRKADDILTIMDEYEAAKAGGKFDVKNLPEAEKEALVRELLDVRVKRFDREKADLLAQLEAEKKARGEVEGKFISRDRESLLQKLLNGKIVPDVQEDAVTLLSGRLQYNADDGKFYAEDGSPAEKFVQAEIDKRKHWQQASKGSGAKGGAGSSAADGQPASMLGLVQEAMKK